MCIEIEIGNNPVRKLEFTKFSGRESITKSVPEYTVEQNAFRYAYISGGSGLYPSAAPSGTIEGPVTFTFTTRILHSQFLTLMAIKTESKRLWDIRQDGSIKLSDRYEPHVDNGIGTTTATRQRAYATGITAATITGVDISYYASYNVALVAMDKYKVNGAGGAGEWMVTLTFTETSVRRP